jgi:hypothetical protein
MKHSPLWIAGMMALSPFWAHAQSSTTVNFSAAPGQPSVMDITGTAALADGNLVEIGYFNSGFDVAAFSQDLLALASAWNEFGSTKISTIFNQPGRFSDSASTSDPAFDNNQIWIWLFQTSDDSSPSAGMENVVGYGLFTSSSQNWSFPVQGSIPLDNTTDVNSSEVDQAYFGSFDSSHLLLEPIPEASATAFLAMGVGPLLYSLRRRRGKNAHENLSGRASLRSATVRV